MGRRECICQDGTSDRPGYAAVVLFSPGIVSFSVGAIVLGATLGVCAFIVLRGAKSRHSEIGPGRGCGEALMGLLLAVAGALLIVVGINFIGYEGN